MDVNLNFLNLDGLDASQVRHLNDLLHPSNLSSEIVFPWSDYCCDDSVNKKESISSLNVHAPAFETYIPSKTNNDDSGVESNYLYSNGTVLPDVVPMVNAPSFVTYANDERTAHTLPTFTNGLETHGIFDSYASYSHLDDSAKPLNGRAYQEASHADHIPSPISSFKLNPTVSSFVPQNIRNYVQSEPLAEVVETIHQNGTSKEPIYNEISLGNDFSHVPQNGNIQSYAPSDKSELLNENVTDDTSDIDTISPVLNVHTPDSNCKTISVDNNTSAPKATAVTTPTNVTADSPKSFVATTKPVQRSWAQIVSSGQTPTDKVPLAKPLTAKGNKLKETESKEADILSIEEDKMSLVLGKHLYELQLDFNPVYLQPRGLINRRNWCYIHATLQALLASSPFYSMLRNLPLGPGVERGKSSTPVIDSMVKITYEFSQLESSQEELQLGQAFQPDFIYDMLKDLKSDCLKGQQEDAEEFLSFILNNMHEEMVKIIKNYEKKNCIPSNNDVKENGDVSDGEEEWQVIGSKHKGMVTRKVVEHKTPISDLLGGQIKSFLTTNGSKTSASIQPFFTLQLDVQSEHVNSVSEALKEMTMKEPIQGYTCAKTKQEVEAYSHIALQKLPPVLILHLKRFVYNKNGGCKKVLKKTDYPLELELSRDLFSSDIKKVQRIRMYKLFAVMYHDGEEAIKGHYITDVYNYGSQTWIRCDDRQITAVTEDQVLSHSPPRVPYLLFYQEK